MKYMTICIFHPRTKELTSSFLAQYNKHYIKKVLVESRAAGMYETWAIFFNGVRVYCASSRSLCLKAICNHRKYGFSW